MGRDDEFYRQFLSGKLSAYDELMILYGDSLTFYLYGYLHNWQDAEDLTVIALCKGIRLQNRAQCLPPNSTYNEKRYCTNLHFEICAIFLRSEGGIFGFQVSV